MLEWIKVLFGVFYDRRMRCRVLGLRPVVVCLIQSSESQEFLLIRPSQKPNAWMPPQEGIEPTESIEKAVVRGLLSELGIAENQMHFRRSEWIGSKKIPEQKGERDIDHSLMKMRGKAYYAALVKVPKEIPLTVNPAEVAEAGWQTIDEIKTNLITNSERKQQVIVDAFRKVVNIDLTK